MDYQDIGAYEDEVNYMRLPMYITGLAIRNIELKKMDGHLFKKLGYEIARKIHGEVLGYIPPRYPLNYFLLDIKLGGPI